MLFGNNVLEKIKSSILNGWLTEEDSNWILLEYNCVVISSVLTFLADPL